MEIIRSSATFEITQGEKFQDGIWEPIEQKRIDNSIVISEFSDEEHDSILDIKDRIDPFCLRGFKISLIVSNPEKDDPKTISIACIPVRDQILRHMDRYYLVNFVVQSSTFSIAAYVNRMSQMEFDFFLKHNYVLR